MKIWTLLENTACREDMRTEHGLSLYLETEGRKILFDAGQSDAFLHNAQRLGIDLQAVDMAVLSHGHYDHGGGLPYFLKINRKAPVYAQKTAFQPYYHGTEKYIGLPSALKQSDRVIFTGERTEIAPGITLYGAGGFSLPDPVESYGLSVLQNGSLVPDRFLHEQYLLICEQSRRILFSGCSHRGILNIMERFHPDVLVGGFHFKKLSLLGADREKLEKAGELLLQYPTVYYTGHCTGQAQYRLLKTIMGERLHTLSTGKEIIL